MNARKYPSKPTDNRYVPSYLCSDPNRLHLYIRIDQLPTTDIACEQPVNSMLRQPRTLTLSKLRAQASSPSLDLEALTTEIKSRRVSIRSTMSGWQRRPQNLLCDGYKPQDAKSGIFGRVIEYSKYFLTLGEWHNPYTKSRRARLIQGKKIGNNIKATRSTKVQKQSVEADRDRRGNTNCGGRRSLHPDYTATIHYGERTHQRRQCMYALASRYQLSVQSCLLQRNR